MIEICSKLNILPLSLLQCTLLAMGQVTLKMSLARMKPFGWNIEFMQSVLLNWRFALCGLCFGAAALLWMLIIKNYPLSQAYPLVSLSYAIGILAAMVFFHETVTVTKWVGVALIIAGCWLMAEPASAQQQVTADFIQTKTVKMLNEKSTATGKMAYQAPNHLTWEYTKPFVCSLKLNGNQVTLTRDGKKAPVNDSAGKMLREVARVMMSSVARKGTRSKQDLPLTGGLSALFKRITIYYDTKTHLARRIIMQEEGGDVTEIVLKNVVSK